MNQQKQQLKLFPAKFDFIKQRRLRQIRKNKKQISSLAVKNKKVNEKKIEFSAPTDNLLIFN